MCWARCIRSPSRRSSRFMLSISRRAVSPPVSSHAAACPRAIPRSPCEGPMSIVVTILSFLVTVGVLVVIHELGHYAAARLMDVKILRFNVGFGRPLWMRRRGPDRTEWVIAAIPLGGYVKMLDEREGEVEAHEAGRAFNRKSVWARIFIVLAGPIANLAL